MWQPQWAATIWKIAGSGVSIKLLSVMKLLSTIKPVSVLGRAVMALLFLSNSKVINKNRYLCKIWNEVYTAHL